MLKIRLRRMGAKKQPFYRIIVADSRAPRDGAFVEELGYYNPAAEPVELKVDNERAQQWMKNGAASVEVSAMSYVLGMLENEDATNVAKDAVCSIYYYWKAALNYLSAHQS